MPLSIILGLLLLFAWLGHLWSSGSTGQQTAASQRTQPPPADRTQGPPQSYFFYLFDVSRSMNTGAPDSPYRRAIPLLGSAIRALSGDEGPPAPQLHRVGTIGNMSLNQAILCEINVPRRAVFRSTDTSASADSLRSCTSRLGALRPAEYTDISGGLKYASLALQGNGGAARGILMFTDLEEDLPSARETAIADLGGICIVVYYEITGNEPTHPSDLDKRIESWRTRFKAWHAQGSLFRLTSAFSPDDLNHFFTDCERGK